MKSLKHALFLFLLAVLAACSEDSIAPQAEIIPSTGEESVDLISMVVPDIEIADATTRSKLIEDGTELKFVWQENDAIGVVPMSGNPLRFPIHAENAQKNTALFDGGQWALRTDAKYAAFFPYMKTNYEKDAKSIIIDYTGQTQGNWMKYDFLATGAVQPKDGAVKFTMKRLSAILKIQVKILSSSVTQIRDVTLVAPEPLFGVKGTLDLSGSEPVYKPEGLTKFIHTDLGVEKSVSSSESTFFTFYLMIPPTDLSGKQMRLLFNSDSGTTKEVFFTGKNYEAGKAYSLDVYPNDALIRNANLIVAAGLGDGSSYINALTNRERILQVKKIDVSYLNDPTVCDEIGFFRNLEELNCSSNSISSLDVSNNPKLTYLSCPYNQLAALDVSNNTALTYLDCYDNRLTSLDVSNCDCSALQFLNCKSNQLTTLDVSNNTALTYLQCSSNRLTSLDVSNCTALTNLQCGSNRLTSLDASNCTALTTLQCGFNYLTSLDVFNCTVLTTLDCYDNQLTSLDASNCTALSNLNCYSNQLTSLDVSNNPALTILCCFKNQLTSLDVSNNPALSNLNCYSNQLTSLDVSNNPALTYFSCYSNQLSSLDVSNNPALEILHCYSNQLISLDVSSCTALTNLDCYDNQLTSLDVSNNMALTDLYCNNNQISSFTVRNHSSLKALYIHYNPKLTSLDCSNNILSTLSITGCTALKSLDCNKNRLRYLDISKLFPTLTKYNVFCGSQKDDSGASQVMTLTHNAQDNTTLRETSLRNWNVTLVASE